MFLCKPVSIKADKGWRIVLGEGSPHCLNQPVCALDTILTLQIKKLAEKFHRLEQPPSNHSQHPSKQIANSTKKHTENLRNQNTLFLH